MNRQITTQVLAMLVVLAMLMRWIPGDRPDRDAFGRGAPWYCLRVDSELQAIGDEDGMRALLRGSRQVDPQGFRQYWMRRLRQVHEILAEADDDTLVQFKGVPRNAQWQLVYDLYPVRTAGKPMEEGSTNEDPTLPGVTTVLEGLLQTIPSNMDPARLKRLRKNAPGRVERTPGEQRKQPERGNGR
jgi:hypothetical protein